MNTQAVEETVSVQAGQSDKDQRSFIETLRGTGDVVFVDKAVHWDLELGAISRRMTEIDGPAILSQNIRDYPGQGFFVDPFSPGRRAAITLGLPAHARIP